jgi:hypothetical protein
MSYRKYSNSKSARRKHKKRDQRAKKNARKKGGIIEPFAYQDVRGKSKKQLSARLGSVR